MSNVMDIDLSMTHRTIKHAPRVSKQYAINAYRVLGKYSKFIDFLRLRVKKRQLRKHMLSLPFLITSYTKESFQLRGLYIVYHYENLSMQYTEIFKRKINENFIGKN